MPIVKDVVTCVNHPGRRMHRNDRPAVLHPVDLVDGKPAPVSNRGIFLEPYVCLECGYVEFYAVDKQRAVSALHTGEDAEDAARIFRMLLHEPK
jgi:hypothetical protein